MQNGSLSVLSRAELAKLKRKALRSGDWFRVLRSVERALVDLTIKVVDQVRSSVLAKSLLSVVGKLVDALKNRVDIAVKEIGVPCACRLSLFAQKWGNKSAQRWISDLSFARFIAIMHINDPALFGS